MEPDEAPVVLRWARRYAAQGRIAPADLQAIEAECTAAMAAPPASGAGVTLSQVLHSLGGSLLAAAAIAAVLLLFPQPTYNGVFDQDAWLRREVLQAWTLGALGIVGAGIGFGLFYRTRNRDLADAFLVAALTCLASMGMPSQSAGRFLAPVGLVATVAIPLLRRGAVVAALSGFGFALAAFRTYDVWFGAPFTFNLGDRRLGASLWLALAALHLAAVAWGRIGLGAKWLTLALGVEAVAVVPAIVAFAGDVLDPGRSAFHQYGGTEILIALAESGLLAFAILRREAPLLVAAAFVISVDAVVFAFDVGGQKFGVVSLLVVSAAVLGLGTVLRKRWPGRSPA